MALDQTIRNGQVYVRGTTVDIELARSESELVIGRLYWESDGFTRVGRAIEVDEIRWELSISDVGDKNYYHPQTIASNTWEINHYLGKRPSVEVRDSADRQIIGFGRQDLNQDNKTILTFGFSFSGKAYLN